MACVIGKINPLAGIRLAIDPAHSSATEHFCDESESWNRYLFHEENSKP
jgi:hypothetical protein